MNTTLYAHQKSIIKEDKKKFGIFLGTGGGKTRTALSLAQGSTLIIMPKTQWLDKNWEREMMRMGYDELAFKDFLCLSKEEFKKRHELLQGFTTVIIDEAHTVLGVTPNIRYRNRQPIPKASQLFETVHEYIQRTKPERVYLCTATPARNPMSIWAAATLLGAKWDWDKFRRKFYVRLPIPGREIWQAKKDEKSKNDLADLVKRIGYVGRLQDWFDVPEQIDKTVICELGKEQKETIDSLAIDYPDPLVLIGKTHQAEQGMSKIEKIKELLEEFPKVIVFARYLHQIATIQKHFEKDIKTYVLTGDTKNRKEIIEQAEKDEQCLFVAQSQISTGYELPSFRCMIFASMSYSHVDHMQARGRILRANALNKNLYVYLVSGEIDKEVLQCAENHIDFDEKLYAQKRSEVSNGIKSMAPGKSISNGSHRIETNANGFTPFQPG